MIKLRQFGLNLVWKVFHEILVCIYYIIIYYYVYEQFKCFLTIKCIIVLMLIFFDTPLSDLQSKQNLNLKMICRFATFYTSLSVECV